MKLIQNTIFTALSLFFISCGDNTETPITDIKNIVINESNITIYSTDGSNTSGSFTATLNYTDGTSFNATNLVTWNSSDTTVAEVSNGELLAGNANGGDANITVNYKSIYSTASVVNVVKLLDYNISMLGADANTTGTYILLAIGTFEDNTTRTIVKNISWDLNNSAVVTGEGLLTKVEITSTGDTNITSTLFYDVNMSKTIVYTAN